MPKYVIEREIPKIGDWTADQLKDASKTSVNVLNELGPDILWLHSYVTGDKLYCVYESPNEEMIREHAKRGEDLPWQRVYGFFEESHIRFNHAPHIRAGVNCETCHGDLAQMTVAERVVDHKMGFCINCHKQKGASNECITCHF